jgi:5'-deoxynucleotidase YfbR-like HD superfamily hydrolase
MSPNRIVALVTPVCALGAGWVATWLADHVPGLNIPQESLQAVFIAGALSVLAPALHWLHGWQKFEARESETAQLAVVADAATALAEVAEEGEDLEDLDLPEDEFEELDELDDLGDVDELEDDFVLEDEETVSPR